MPMTDQRGTGRLGASALRRIAEDRPADLGRYLDAARLDRFGAAFAAAIAAEAEAEA